MKAIGGNLSKSCQAMGKQREYDRETVNQIVRLAKTVMSSGLMDNMSRTEVNRLLGLVKNTAGREDITWQANTVVEMLLKHQVKECENILARQMKAKASKLNASGVEIQAGLDIKVQPRQEEKKAKSKWVTMKLQMGGHKKSVSMALSKCIRRALVRNFHETHCKYNQ